MTQYSLMEIHKVKDYNGNEIQVRGFRKRQKYDPNDIIVGRVTQDKILRPDIVCVNLYGSYIKIGNLIDTNEKDIFSFVVGGEFKYLNPSVTS